MQFGCGFDHDWDDSPICQKPVWPWLQQLARKVQLSHS